MPNNYNRESGNILLYVLGAIALLGLLIISVKGSSTPGSNINEEELLIRVAEIQQYGAELEQAVSYVMQNGFSETDIRFAHPDADSAYGVITDIPQRQIFSRDGGGATYRQPPSDIQVTATDWVFNGNNNVPLKGTTNADLIAFLPNVSAGFCIQLNDVNDIENPSGAPPQDSDNFDITSFYTGTFNNSETIGDSSLIGSKGEGCIEGNGTPADDTYHYYRVLLAR